MDRRRRLGVPLHEQPLAEELTKAYRKLAFAYHPDQSSRPGTEEIFRDLTAAYQALKRWAQKAYPR